MYTTLLHTPELSQQQQSQILAQVEGTISPSINHHRLQHPQAITTETLAALRNSLPFDINTLPTTFKPEEVGLFISDMDSTLIAIECIDEIADCINIKDKVSAITEAAMRGELNFESSLTQRVHLLKGLPSSALQQVYDERLVLNPGAEKLIDTLNEKNIVSAVVSGGFTFFTERLKQRLGLTHSLANVLEEHDDHLTGHVVGGIVGSAAKAEYLLSLCDQHGLEPSQAIAIGDGANDLEMLKTAGIGIAYHAKPAVQAQADIVFNHSGLDAVLDLLVA